MRSSINFSMLAAGLSVCLVGCGITQPQQTGGFVPIVGSNAVYVSDAVAGTVVEENANLLQNGALTPQQTLTGVNGVTQVTPATDGNALYACTSGAIQVLAIDHAGQTGSLTRVQTFSTAAFLDTPRVAVADAGGFLVVAGTQGGVATVVALPVNADDTLAAPASVQSLGVNAAPDGITDVGGSAVAVTLQQATNDLVGLAFNAGALTLGNSLTVGNATAVTNNGTFVYAAGTNVLSGFTEDATGTLAAAPFGSANTGGVNTSLVLGANAAFVGNTLGVIAVPLNADGSFGAPLTATVKNANGVAAGVNALAVDTSNFVYPALSGGGITSLAFPTLTNPIETAPVSSGGSNPTSVATVGI